jgi:hypothetical protein
VTPCVVYTVHVKIRNVSFLVQPQNQGRRFVSGLTSKPLGWFFRFGLKTGGDDFLRFGLKNGSDGFHRFGLKTDDDGFSRFALKIGGDFLG